MTNKADAPALYYCERMGNVLVQGAVSTCGGECRTAQDRVQSSTSPKSSKRSIIDKLRGCKLGVGPRLQCNHQKARQMQPQHESRGLHDRICRRRLVPMLFAIPGSSKSADEAAFAMTRKFQLHVRSTLSRQPVAVGAPLAPPSLGRA